MLLFAVVVWFFFWGEDMGTEGTHENCLIVVSALCIFFFFLVMVVVVVFVCVSVCLCVHV